MGPTDMDRYKKTTQKEEIGPFRSDRQEVERDRYKETTPKEEKELERGRESYFDYWRGPNEKI